MTILQSIKAFLNARKAANADLVERWHTGMETQVNVREGERVPDIQGIAYTSQDGTEFWHPIRIPRNAWSEPYYNDRPAQFPLDEYATDIGSTGWNWRERVSEWVGFDFDSLVGHVEGLSKEQLSEIQAAVCELPFIELRRSTSGQGWHVYAFTEVSTANHDEHAQLAYVVLQQICQKIGRDLQGDVDVCGGNFWIWSTRATAENHGLELLKPATEKLQESSLPINWRDIKKPRSARKHSASDGPVPELDDSTRKIIDDLRAANYYAEWDERLGLLRTHTLGLQQIAHTYPGQFTTISSGSTQQNCFCFPHGSGLKVYRHNHAREHESWQRSEDWSYTYFGVPLTLAQAAAGLTEMSKGYSASFGELAQVCQKMGLEFSVPEIELRPVQLLTKDTRLMAKMKVLDSDPATIPNWGQNGRSWERVFGIKENRPQLPDDLVRYMVGDSGKRIGWCSLIADQYTDDTQDGVFLTIAKYNVGDPKVYLSEQKSKALKIVCIPFGDEYPAPGEWNRFAPQLAYPVSDESGPHPHFDIVLQHVGKYLTPYVAMNDWCVERGINTGPKYLLYWCASLIQQPFQLLPMLFFCGPQYCGKSSFVEMLKSLFTKGVNNIDKCFQRDSTFDGELSGTILGTIEEVDLSGRYALPAYQKIKKLTTNKSISIERKGLDAYEQRNCCHIVQIANHSHHCPIPEADDSRITCFKVANLPAEVRVADGTMTRRWAEEAPYFLRTLKRLQLPEATDDDDRLFLPAITSPLKQEILGKTSEILEQPLNEQKDVSAAIRLEPAIRKLAHSHRLINVTASDVLALLRDEGVDDLPSPTEIGRILRHLDATDLTITGSRTSNKRLLTIVPSQWVQLEEWFNSFEDTVEEDFDGEAA